MYYYYYHPESGSAWKQTIQSSHIDLEEEISKETYDQITKELEIMNDSYLATQLQLFLDIAAVTGKGSAAKKAELLAAGYSEDIEMMLMVAFEPSISTHIKSIKVHNKEVTSPYTMHEIVQKITSVKALTKGMKKEVEDFVNAQQLSDDQRKVLVKVLTKKLSIGLAPKGINKAIGKKLFDTVEFMKAEDKISIVEKWFEEELDVVAEIKYDGIRGIAKFSQKRIQSMETYNKTQMDLVPLTTLISQLNEFAAHFPFDGLDFFLDFEITGKNRQSVSGEINSLLKGKAKPGIDKKWLLNIFDVHTTDICDGETPSKVNYTNRRKVLTHMHDSVLLAAIDIPNIKIAQAIPVKDMDHVQKLFETVVSQGEEGLMLKRTDGVYEMKRSKNWVKQKAEEECELRVVSWYAGEGKREATIGGFRFASADNLIQVNVGGGYKDADLAEIMKYSPDAYIGKIATIIYNETIDKKDNEEYESLFLPRFVVWRFDKDVADNRDKIK